MIKPRSDLICAGSKLQNSPLPLKYSDVFVLSRSSELRDDVRDDENNVTSQASGVVRGLRAANIPVCVLEDVQHASERY